MRIRYNAPFTLTFSLFCVAVLDSFVIDWFLRQKVTTNINMFFVYQLPVPRLSAADAR